MTPPRKRIYEIYSAYAEGQFERLLRDMVDDDITFVSYAPAEIFPYFKRGQGKAALRQAWEASRADLEFLNYIPLLIVSGDDDTAAAIVQMRVKRQSTGKVLQLMVADFLRFRGDRVLEFRQFMDTLDAVQQWMGRQIHIPRE